ncbi:MAG: anthranilate synthase component II [Halobacteriales archaeon]
MTGENDATVLFVDNFDSFTWNLVDYTSVEGVETVVENNRVTLERVDEIAPDGIVVSPGPGHPANERDIGNVLDILHEFDDTPTLGVCLGHQAMAQAYGGEVGHAPEPVHGKTARLEHDGEGIYADLPQDFPVGRYHSLCVTDVPDEFRVTARGGGIVMGIRHDEKPLEGVQFHPESVLTAHGHEMMENFLRRVRDGGQS